MLGTRIDEDEANSETFPCPLFRPGEYGKSLDGIWYFYPPCERLPHAVTLSHRITEHEDGTVTVSPSILVKHWNPNPVVWHGYLERGVWREC